MKTRETFAALAVLMAGAGFVHQAGPSTAVSASTEESVVVVITLTRQPALSVMADLRPTVVEGIGRERDAADAQLQRVALERIADLMGPSQQRISQAVQAHGGTVLSRLRGYGAIVARMPRRNWKQLSRQPDVLAVELESQYRRTQDLLSASAVVLPPPSLHRVVPGTVDIAVVDTGLRIGHPVFSAHASGVFSRIFHNSARLQSDYADDDQDPDDHQGHGTSVAGVLFMSGLDWLSQLPAAAMSVDHVYNLKAAYRARDGASHATQGDVMTAIDASLGFSDPPEVINYSYGSDAAVDDDGYCRFFDNVVDTFGKTMTLSAGNAGLRAIGTPGIAYNVISVANVNDQGTLERADDTIAPTSSAGPTPGGRRKPDIAALGSHISTASRSGGYEQVTGTSFAAPAIAAAAARLVDAGITDPRAVKALMINSADDFGAPGWDIDFGWGYFNGLRTEKHLDHHVLGTLRPGHSGRRQFFARVDRGDTKATLVWNRHVTQGNSYLNDLDLLLYNERTGVLDEASISSEDNVEQVASASGAPAVFVVESRDRFEGAAETYALAHSGGFVERRGPDVRVDIEPLNTANEANEAGLVTIRARVANTGDVRGHGYEARLQVPKGFELVSSAARQPVGSLGANESVMVEWQLRSRGRKLSSSTFSVEATANCYGWTWRSEARHRSSR